MVIQNAFRINNYKKSQAVLPIMSRRIPFILPIALVLIIVVAILSASAHASTGISLDRICIAYCKDCVPFHFSDDSGQPAGIMVDLWRLWSEKTGISIDFKEGAWDDTIKIVASGTADVHAGLFFNEEWDRFLDYGATIAKTKIHYFSHIELPPIKVVEGLAAYRVGVVQGDYLESFLKERLPAGAVAAFPDYQSLMKTLQDGSLLVFAADKPVGLFYLKKNGLLPEFTFADEKPLYNKNWVRLF